MADEINYTRLGEKIRAAREHKGLTQEQLAEICQLSTAHIGHIERGTRIPSLDTVYRVSTSLGVSFDYLLLDSLPSNKYSLTAIENILSRSDEEKAKQYITIIKAIAEKIDEI
jgi:transcriptional regulator with XRE-family HTH domain